MSQIIALIPAFCPSLLRSRSKAVLTVVAGVLLLALAARVTIPLPFTPIPITGQTFGVTFLALLLGRRLAFGTVAAYLFSAACGAPVLSGGAAWAGVLGPTSGYLVGMLASSWVVGGLADRGATRTLKTSFIAAASGSLCVYAFGVAGLLAFVPLSKAIPLGVLPFLPGDVIKTTLACVLARSMDRRQRESGTSS